VLRWLLVAAALAAVAAPKIAPHVDVEHVWPPDQWFAHGADASATPADFVADRGRAGAALKVSAVVVEPARLAEIVRSTGTLLPDEGVELQAEVSGRITAIHFTEGAPVRKGDLLVKLNDADLQARLTAARRELELAVRRERRAAELLEQSFVRQDEYDAVRNSVDAGAAEIELTEAQIAKTEIRAPFDGIAGLRFVSEGAIVGATTRIATLQRTEPLKIEFSVPERYAGRLEVGRPISFSVVGRGETFTGRVYAYDPRIDPATRTVLIRATCPNPNRRLLPGGFANVELTLAETADALLIPTVALMPDGNSTYVFVLDEGTADRRPVETGVRTDSRIQILAGLAPGDVVITSGLQQLRPGSPVALEPDAGIPLSHVVDGAGSTRNARAARLGAAAEARP
jgi:membrane fusion protein, multidrug efflux system